MAEDPKISQEYRALPREEPPRALDDAILSASRRALVRRRRWAVPLAAAAVIVLAVAIVAQIDREPRESKVVAPSAERRADEGRRAPEVDRAARRELREAPAQAPASAAAPMMGKVVRAPEQWLQAIAELRRQGKDEEADRELAEFRKSYPDYRLPDEMKAKVEKRR